MASNTFALPSSSKSIGLARQDWNDSLQAVLQSFYGSTAPGPSNIEIEGVQQNPIPNGLIFRSANTGVLYIVDSVNNKGNPVHGSSLTVNGIGSKIVSSLASVDITKLEVGELFKTVGANSRMYMKSSNAGAIVDIGLPASNSVIASMLSSTIDLGSL